MCDEEIKCISTTYSPLYGEWFFTYKNKGYCSTSEYFTRTNSHPETQQSFSFLWWNSGGPGQCRCLDRSDNNDANFCANYYGSNEDRVLWSGSNQGCDGCASGDSVRMCARLPNPGSKANPISPLDVQACLAFDRPELINSEQLNFTSPKFCQQPFISIPTGDTNEPQGSRQLYDSNHPCSRVYEDICSKPENILGGPKKVCNGGATSYCNISQTTYNSNADARSALSGPCGAAMQQFCNLNPQDIEHCSCLTSFATSATISNLAQILNICYNPSCTSNANAFKTAFQYDALNSGLCQSESVCLQVYNFAQNTGEFNINDPIFQQSCGKYIGSGNGNGTPTDWTRFFEDWWLPLLLGGLTIFFFIFLLIMWTVLR